MSLGKIQELFEEIAISTPQNIITSSINSGDSDYLILVFKDNNGLAHILVEAKEGFIKFDSLKGIVVSNKQYVLEGILKTNFYEYRCQHKEYHGIFFPFITDVLTNIEQGKSFLEAHNKCFNLWKHFFENPQGAIMSVEKEIGLIGELLFLIRLLDFDENAIEYWFGPSGGVDFFISSNRIEIKTTLKEFHIHTINGLEQLQDVQNTNLFLGSFKLQMIQSEHPNGLSLASIYNDALELINENPVLTDVFNEKIALLNLTPGIIRMHDFRKYIEVDFKLFEIDNAFPRITSHDFKLPLNNRISRVRYDIYLENFEHIGSFSFLFS